MSLQVWLPLNGDLHNQGLSNITVTNNGATVDNSGKIGKCYSFNGSNYITLPTTVLANFTNDISACAWINISAWNSSYDSIIKMYAGNNAWNNSIFAMGRNNTASRLYFSIANGSSSTQSSCTLTTDQSLNTWYHIACVYNSIDKNMKIYLNGELKVTYSTTIVPNLSSVTSIGIGGSPLASYGLKGKLNDVRIYNHALSPKEVEEIAKGLVLHYKLDDRFCEATTNLYSTLDGVSTSCYNGSNGKYGYGSNSDVYKTTGIFNGRQSLKVYMGTSGNSARPYPYFSNLFVSDGTNAPAYKTLSFDYYGTIGAYLNFYKLGSGSGTGTWKNITNNTSGNFTNSGNIAVTINKWQHIELTLHGTTNANAEWGYCILGDAHTSNTSNYWLFANIQLETKDHATGFAGYGATRSPTTIYDSSGYSRNGTITGSLTAAAGSPRYGVATVFDGSSYIQLRNQLHNIKDEITANIWIKRDWTTNAGTPFGCVEGGGWGWQCKNANIAVLVGTGTSSNTYISQEISMAGFSSDWHMLSFTYDGYDLKAYIDGIINLTINKYETKTPIYYNNSAGLFIGAEAKSSLTNPDTNSKWPKLTGSLSDFRVYAVALTADQIKELYTTSMSIDSSGNIYARELVEL